MPHRSAARDARNKPRGTLPDASLHLGVLACGARLAVLNVQTLHQTVLWAELEVGSRFERQRESGLSHFLEHMLFRGTPTLPSADAVALAVDDLGASLEASTSADTGTLSAVMPPESFDAVAPIFAEVFQRPVFDAIETERGIVREEILEDLDEKGRLVDADTLLMALAFEGHPLGQPITGTLDHLAHFDVPTLEAHHRRHYTADSTVLTVVGPVEPEAVRDRLDGAFRDLPHGPSLTVQPPPPQMAPRFRHTRHLDSQTAIRVGFRAPGAEHEDEPAVQLLMRLLDDGMSTRLYRRICDEKGLCYDVSADYAAFRDVGLVSIAADTAHARADEVLGEILGIVSRLRDEGPTFAELDRAKRRHAWALGEILDAPGDLAELVALSLIVGRDPSLEARLEEIQTIDMDRVRRVARELFRPEALSVVAVGDGNRGRKAALAARALGFE